MLAGVVGGVGAVVVGQREALGHALQEGPPERAVFGAVRAGEAFPLPVRPVAELDRHLGHARRASLGQRPVVLQEFLVEAHVGPLVDERVRHRLDDLVVVLGHLGDRETQHRVGGQVEGAAHLLGDELRPARLHLLGRHLGGVVTRQVGEGEVGPPVGVHPQEGPAVLGLGAGAQEFVAAHQAVRRAPEELAVEGAAHAEPVAEGVGGGPRIELVEDPQAFLVHAEREPVARSRPRAQHRAVAGGEPAGERGALGGAEPGEPGRQPLVCGRAHAVLSTAGTPRWKRAGSASSTSAAGSPKSIRQPTSSAPASARSARTDRALAGLPRSEGPVRKSR